MVTPPSVRDMASYMQFLKELSGTYSYSTGKRTVSMKRTKISRRTGLAGYSMNQFTRWLHENGLAAEVTELSSGRMVYYNFNLPAVRNYLSKRGEDIKVAGADDRSGQHSGRMPSRRPRASPANE
ncbi:MAG: hypothetical protein V1887_01030 [Candidatus Aenigmatarchaeota archaeon]